jgi:hypothetical protein
VTHTLVQLKTRDKKKDTRAHKAEEKESKEREERGVDGIQVKMQIGPRACHSNRSQLSRFHRKRKKFIDLRFRFVARFNYVTLEERRRLVPRRKRKIELTASARLQSRICYVMFVHSSELDNVRVL